MSVLSPLEEVIASKFHEDVVHVHIINPTMNTHLWDPVTEANTITVQDIVYRARVQRIQLLALCRYRFTPTQDPGDLPVCEKCIEIAQILMAQAGE